MRDPSARHEFVVGRARVRQILGQYVSQPPNELDVVARVDHKPTLAGAPPWFDFSFSRCAGLHVCAVGRDRRIGIDVEASGSGRDDASLMMAYASSLERRSIDALAAEERAAAILALWTRKEACMKALGIQHQLSPHAFVVPLTADGVVTGLRATREGGPPWVVRGFRPKPGVTGALVAEGSWAMLLLPFP